MLFCIQIVRPLESTAETQPQLKPALLRLSAIISQYFMARNFGQFIENVSRTRTRGQAQRAMVSVARETKSRHALKRDG